MARYILAILIATAAATASAQSFDTGLYLVGTDIQAGTYEAPGGALCLWQRLRGVGADDIITSGSGAGQKSVEIWATDYAFLTARCGTWELVDSANNNNDKMWSDLSTMVVVALMQAVKREAGPDLSDTIFRYAWRIVDELRANPDNPYISNEAADQYMELLRETILAGR